MADGPLKTGNGKRETGNGPRTTMLEDAMQFIAAVALALVVSAPVDDTKLGAGVTLEQATPIAAIVQAPADYVGKTVRVDGVATAVCEMMGCWLAVAESDAKDAP